MKNEKSNTKCINFLEKFDEIVEAYIKEKNSTKQVLSEIFEIYTDDIYSFDEFSKKINSIKIKIRDEIEKTYTSTEKDLFEQYMLVNNVVTSELVEKSFYYAFSIAISLRDEIDRYKNKDI